MKASENFKALLLASLLASAAVISCNNPFSDALNGSEEFDGKNGTDFRLPTGGGQTGFEEAQYFGGLYLTQFFAEYRLHPDPVVTAVSSRAEFEQKFDINAESMSAAIFADSTAKYTDGFFKNNFLIIVSIADGNGGQRYNVESVGGDDGKVVINRFVGPGPAIPTFHTIVISMKKEYKLKDYNVVFNEVSVDPPVIPPPPPFYGFEAQYIRTGSVLGEAKDPVVISSTSELNRYALSIPNIHISSDGVAGNGFTDNISKYTDDFFRTDFLVIIPKVEGSGSVRHEVKSVDNSGNIVIDRLLPDFGTDDIAGWHIVIELSNDAKLEKYNVKFVDRYIYKIDDPPVVKLPYDFEARYIRTGDYSRPAENPVVIFSKAELEKYDLTIPDYIINSEGVGSNGFTPNIAKYTDDFFKTKFLVIVHRGEPSGSIRHEVESVDGNGNIVINRLLPGLGTADIGSWHIIIELKKEYKEAKEYKAVFVDKSI